MKKILVSTLLSGFMLLTPSIKGEVSFVGNNIFQGEKLVLNNGKKWVVVPEMMKFLKNMDYAVVEFDKKENPTKEEYQNLAVLIDKNIRDLTANCTMKGQAHDELHKWLVPFMTLSTAFDEAEKIENLKDVYLKIKASYKTFNTYFK